MTDSLSILLVSLERWPTVARFPRALADAGFEVIVCAAKADPIALAPQVKQRVVLPPNEPPQRQIGYAASAIAKLKPTLVMPVDEASSYLLTGMQKRMAQAKEADQVYISECIKRSRGDVEQVDLMDDKQRTTELARSLGLLVPAERVTTSVDAALAFGAEHGFPIVLKNPHGYGGVRVAVVGDEAEARQAFARLAGPEAVICQQYIDGQPAMINLAAHGGQVLESATFQKTRCHPGATGPSAVVSLIEHPGIRDSAEKFVEATGCSGIISLDFMVDGEGRAFLIECNPRPTPVSHLGLVTGKDLMRALYCSYAAESDPSAPRYESAPFQERTIALFPKELLRDDKSPYLNEAHHDVPWDEPAILLFYMQYYGKTKMAEQKPGAPKGTGR